MTLFEEFHAGTLNLHSLNFGTIILLPKSSEAKQIQQYRPICLLNVSFKIFTKVATNRLTVTSALTDGFSTWKKYNGGVVILHETLHELHKKKRNGIVFKNDFEKAYDKVRWNFLQQTLRMKGFSPKWSSWVQSFVQQGNVGVKVNDQVGSYFQTKKGVRQGDPLSPLLFNIVVDMLAIMINRAKDAGNIEGLIPHLVEDGLSILRYVDDTHDIEQVKNLKLLLCAFEQLSGLKINFHKSEIFYFGQAKQQEESYSHLFGCSLGFFPFRYLGIPMHFRKLSNKDWALVEDRFEKRLSGWKGKLLLVGGRLVLINSVLSSLPMFMLSFFEVPKGVARWEILCQPKDQGGLGILNLDLQNKCLLSFWLFKLCNEERVWQQLIRNKYLKNKTLSQVEKRPGDSLLVGLVLRVSNITLQEENDVFIWGLRTNGFFSVQSMYKYLVNSNKRVLVTKDNLSRRNWHGDKSCAFCGSTETIQHLFFECQYAKFLWRVVHMSFGIVPPLNAGELTGSGYGPNCSEMKIKHKWSFRAANG
ncbi:hypothetical protein U9M48_012339 [Paspalum notatum var. saurae]|uniref:Reverse transcriptase domain-containing protein n=1 Tax=Paspalum notatum var. saurae TaxID=547442 RepID=A0AAQ3SXQ2_PASNO